MAMEWVRDNIAQFGGDKGRITMMGQSAGAGMIDHYTYAFSEDPIASGFIMISGASDGYNGPRTPGYAEQTWLMLASNVGCAEEDQTSADQAVLDCMMEKAADDLVDAMARPNIKKGDGFIPTQDDVLVYADHTDMASAEGGYLLGVADFEGGIQLPMWPNASKFMLRALGHIIINCPTAARANKAAAEGKPTWRYRYFGEFPNLEATTEPRSGSWHGADV
jgi:carboxylesterase type B